MDTKDAIRLGGDTGPAIVPKDVKDSLLIEAIRWTDEDLQMPPKKKLSAEQIADFEKLWLDETSSVKIYDFEYAEKNNLLKYSSEWAINPN